MFIIMPISAIFDPGALISERARCPARGNDGGWPLERAPANPLTDRDHPLEEMKAR